MTDLATLQSWLLDAEQAMHDLMMGRRLRSFGEGETRGDYSDADPKALEGYIGRLRRQIATHPDNPAAAVSGARAGQAVFRD